MNGSFKCSERDKVNAIRWKSVPHIDNTISKVWTSVKFIRVASSLGCIVELIGANFQLPEEENSW